MEAALAAGASDFHVLRRHLLPNILVPAVVMATLDLGSVVLSIAALSFLGLGDRPPAAEWGSMLHAGRVDFRLHPHLVLGANLLADSLRTFWTQPLIGDESLGTEITLVIVLPQPNDIVVVSNVLD